MPPLRLRRDRLVALLAPCLVAAALGLTSSAAAQDEEDRLRRAVTLFEASEELYNQGELAQAADLLRRAYALHADPTLLFNLARALEGLGELDEAIETYERYLVEGEAIQDRGAIETRLATLRTQRDALQERADEPTTDPGPDASPEEHAAEPEGRPVDPAGWIVAGAGVVLIGVAIPLGIVSADRDAAAQTEPVQRRADALHGEAQDFALAANVLYGVGAAVTLAGVTWGILSLVLTDDDDTTEPTATLAITPSGLRASGQF